MKLLKQLKNNIPNQIFKRGENYYKNGHIRDYDISRIDKEKIRITSTVRGSRNYVVELDIEIIDNRLEFDGGCNCPYWGQICKHEVAVLHRFLINDFEKSKKILRGNYEFNQLVQLVEDSKDSKGLNLTYKIKGLETKSMVNFKLTLESDKLSEFERESLIDSLLNSLTSYYYNRNAVENYLAVQDQINLSYFQSIDCSRSSTPGALLFAKNTKNFNYIINLIKNNEVYLEEKGVRAEVGGLLRPELIISGDETQIKLTKNNDYQVHQGQGVKWVVSSNQVHPFIEELNLDLPTTIDIPEEEKGKFLFEVLPNLQNNFPSQISDSLKDYNLIKKIPEIKLNFDCIVDIIKCQVDLVIGDQAYSNSEIVGFDLTAKHYQQNKEDPKLWNAVDTEAIEQLLSYLEEYNFYVKPDCFYIKDANDLQRFIIEGINQLPQQWEVNTTEEFDQIEIIELELEPIIEFEEDDGQINWFEFKVTYSVGGKSYTREELEKLMKKNQQGQDYLQIRNKYFILQQSSQEKNLSKILDNAQKQDDGSYRSNYYNLLYYQNLVKEAGINFKGNRVYNQLNQDITEKNLVQQEEIPIEVKDVLRGYQETGYYWMKFLYKYNFSGILADDMGLGKTLQTLTLLKSINKDKPALIVCPRTLIYNWAAEIDKFFPKTKYLVYYGTPDERKELRKDLSSHQLIITSYSIVSRDYEDLQQEEFSYCILDEAHNIKNRQAKRTKGVKEINSRYKLALTGTPLENSLEELWSVFDFLMAGYLNNYNQFRKKYLNPIAKDKNKERLEDLKKRIAPFILRRKKEEVLDDLPEKMINIYPVEMDKLQVDTYKLVVEQIKEELTETISDKGFNRSRINILAALTKLRQICNHPNLILEKKYANKSSAKLDALLEIVEDAILAGHKLIVFSQFVTMLKLIREKFEEKNISFEYLDGSTRNRMEKVNRFNESEDIKVFLISLKAGGVGLNLTSADIVVHVDPWWNPMVERQATDRAHRIGQKNKVIVYKLITTGTVEEKMLKLQEKKKDIFESVIEDNVSPMDNITWDDIQNLLEY